MDVFNINLKDGVKLFFKVPRRVLLVQVRSFVRSTGSQENGHQIGDGQGSQIS